MLASDPGCLFLQAYGERRDNEECEAFRVCRHGGRKRTILQVYLRGCPLFCIYSATARHEQDAKRLRMASLVAIPGVFFVS